MRHIALHTILLLGMTIFGSTTRLHAQTGGEAVGNLSGQLTVSDMGAAVYSLTFDVPDGGPLTPQIGIAYNSQTAGYGLAGYGFNITGISCITRGGKDLFHDQTVQGVTYTDEDNYFLDGKRLILKEGQQGKDGSIYTVEGNPYEKIVLHGSRSNIWFEVVSKDGIVSQYGKMASSKYVYSYLGRHEIAWYVCRVEDKYKNYILYDYGCSNNSIYPLMISYGLNESNTKGDYCYISFQYKDLGDNSRPFMVGTAKALFHKCISNITSYKNGKVFRKYSFDYDDNSDRSTKKWSRLVSITKENGLGESFPPVSFDWNFLPSSELTVSQIDVNTSSERNGLTEIERLFTAADFNGDGISDIVRVTPVSLGAAGHRTYIYVNKSKRTSSGEVTYEELGPWEMDAYWETSLINFVLEMPRPVDFDGDGYNDLIIPCHKYVKGDIVNKAQFCVIYGSDIDKGNTIGYQYTYSLSSQDKKPLFVMFDADGDGKDEVICIEDGKKDGTYHGFILNYKKRNEVKQDTSCFSISLPYTPKRLFSGDYNNDGLSDLFLLCDKGYKIFYNKGGIVSSSKFSDDTSDTGDNVNNKDLSDIQQGDFDGDGLIDFALAQDDNFQVIIARNNGNGTFSLTARQIVVDKSQEITATGPRSQKITYELVSFNHKLSIMVWDKDNDGLSDIMASHSYSFNYKKANGSANYYTDDKKETEYLWLMSKGSELIEEEKRRVDGVVPIGDSFTGDFDGDGHLELAGYGKSIVSYLDSLEENKIYVYKFGDYQVRSEKIGSICDGMGNRIQLEYSTLTDSKVYRHYFSANLSDNTLDINQAIFHSYDEEGHAVYVIERFRQTPIYVKEVEEHWEVVDPTVNGGVRKFGYPVNSYVLPVSVISGVTRDKGSVGQSLTSYKYENLKVHIAGGGVLGFDKITTQEYVNGELISTNISAVKEREEKYYLPVKTIDSCMVGSGVSVTLSLTSVADYGGTYFSYVSDQEIRDFDGNKVSIATDYDVRRGVVSMETVVNESYLMYKEVNYTYPEKANAFGAWLPVSMTMTQMHRDDESPYSSTTTYKYDNIGNLLSTTVNAGTDMALTTTTTYDRYGNVACSVDSGYGVVSVKQFNDYDETGRYLLRSYTEPESAETEYAYDEMGNLVSETETTNPSSPLTTTYTYDGWGRVIETLSPDGISSKTEMGWGDSDARKYYIKKISDGQPPVTTWYDKGGYETYSETVGPQAPLGICISKTTEYTNKGQVEKVESQSGKLTVWQSFEYDERGRVVTEKSSTGKRTSYTYGNRTVTKDEDGREHTTLTDEWGNVIKTIDPMGNEVVYTYSSNGKPRSITSVSSSWLPFFPSINASQGVPSGITSLHSTVYLEYDAAGNRTKLVDPDAGTMTYAYAADGTLLSQTDGKGVKTTYTFDSLGRVIASNIGGKVITSEYGTSGNDNLRLKRQSMDGNIIEYGYDSLGRVTQQVRTVGSHGVYAFDYTYNKYGQLSKTVYPGGLEVKHSYDKNGYKIKTTADGKVVYNLWQYDGLSNKSNFMDLTYTVERNQKGFEVTRWISKEEDYTPEQLDSIISANSAVGGGNGGNGDFITNFSEFLPLSETIILDQFNMKFDTITCNLLSRQRHNRPWEVFEYDNLDRLRSVKVGNKILLSMQYADNGNILKKSDVGQFSYSDKMHPHAVTRVKKQIRNEELGDELKTQFNALGKIERITDSRQQLVMNIEYGPDQQRWYSCLSENIRQYPNSTQESSLTEPSVQTAVPYRPILFPEEYRSVVYAGNYEKVTEGEGIVREFYYLDNGVIVIKQKGVFTPYQAFTDNLGSVLSILNEEGEKVFDAEYDAWGNQTISKNEIGFQRGYTGHEMLNEFGIINMNGRLYDPVLGRFFSPDNYVQAPDNSQNFNRYSYCLNNPLKYTDPSGEVISTATAMMIVGVASSMMFAAHNQENIWKAGGIALLSSIGTYGIGSACNALAKTGMSAMSKVLINAGMHGLNSGLIYVMKGEDFGSGFVSGALSSGIGSLATNVKMPTWAMIASTTTTAGVAAWATGGSFLQGAIRGMQIGAFNHASHEENNDNVTDGWDIDKVSKEDDSYVAVASKRVPTWRQIEKKLDHLADVLSLISLQSGTIEQVCKYYKGTFRISKNGHLSPNYYASGWRGGGPMHIKTYPVRNISNVLRPINRNISRATGLYSGYRFFSANCVEDRFSATVGLCSFGVDFIPTYGPFLSAGVSFYGELVEGFASGVSNYNQNCQSKILDPDFMGEMMMFGGPSFFGFE